MNFSLNPESLTRCSSVVISVGMVVLTAEGGGEGEGAACCTWGDGEEDGEDSAMGAWVDAISSWDGRSASSEDESKDEDGSLVVASKVVKATLLLAAVALTSPPPPSDDDEDDEDDCRETLLRFLFRVLRGGIGARQGPHSLQINNCLIGCG